MGSLKDVVQGKPRGATSKLINGMLAFLLAFATLPIFSAGAYAEEHAQPSAVTTENAGYAPSSGASQEQALFNDGEVFDILVSPDISHGVVSISNTGGVQAGEIVSLSVLPDTDYLLDSLTYSYGGVRYLVGEYQGAYRFVMPASDIIVEATFVRATTAYIGMQGTYTGAQAGGAAVTMRSLSEPALTTADIGVVSVGDARILNRVTTPLHADKDIAFTFSIIGPGGNHTGNKETAVYSQMAIYTDEECTQKVAEVDSSAIIPGEPIAGINWEHLYPFTIAVGTLSVDETYYLKFENRMRTQGPNSTENQGLLGIEVVFEFVTTQSQAIPPKIDKSALRFAIEEAQSVLDGATIGDANGSYPQTAQESLAAAIVDTQAVLDNEELNSFAELLAYVDELETAVNTFKGSQIFEVKEIVISGLQDNIIAGDDGTVTATVEADPQEAKYTGVRWSASSNISINEETGEWVSLSSGASYITATSTSDPSVSETVNFTIADPVSDYTLTYSYDEANKTASLTKFTCENDVAVNVSIPETTTHEGAEYKVTSITSKSATSNPFVGYADKVKSLTLPQSLTTIQLYGCSGLTNLEWVEAPGLTTLGNYAFRKSTMKTMSSLENVTSMGTYAFYECSNLESITLSDTLTSVPGYSFRDCTSLKEVTIPASVTSIANYAFTNCTSLEKVTFETRSSTSPTATSAFGNCDGVVFSAYDTAESVKKLVAANAGATASITVGSNFTFENRTYRTVYTYDTEEKTAELSEYEILDIESAEAEVVIPDAITYEGEEYAVSSIGDNAFSPYALNRNFIEGITLPAQLERVGEGVEISYYDPAATLHALARDNATSSVGANGGSNFTGTSRSVNVNSLDISAPDQSYTGEAIEPVVIKNGAYTLVEDIDFTLAYEANTNIGTATYEIVGINHYSGTYQGSFEIGKFAFGYTYDQETQEATLSSFVYNGSETTEVAIPSSVQYEGQEYRVVAIADGSNTSGVFGANTKITSVVLPESLTKIGTAAFRECTGLTSITMPNVQTVGSYAFYGCTGFAQFAIPSSTSTFGDYALALTSFETLEIPSTVTSIGTYFLSKNTSLKTITGMEGLSSIPAYMFDSCSSLERIDIPSNISTIGNYAFSNTSFESLEIPSTVTSVGTHLLMRNGSLKSITGMEGLSAIPNYMLNYCTSLTSIDIPSNITSIGTHAFSYTGLTELTIPKSVTSMGDNVCYQVQTLKTVSGLEGLTSIPSYTFYNCIALEQVTIPRGITTINSSAFFQCKVLKEISLPASVTAINANAFKTCSALETINVYSTASTAPTFNNMAFGSCNNVTVHGYNSATTVKNMVTYNGGTASSTSKGSNFTFVTLPEPVVKPVDDRRYTGSAITPDLEVTLGDKTLTFGDDYAVEFFNNTDVGSVDFTVTIDTYEYEGEITGSFEIFQVDLSALDSAIDAAEDAIDSVVVSVDGSEVFLNNYWIAEADLLTFKDVLESAKAIFEDEVAPQSNIDDAVSALVAAQEEFDNSKQPGSYVADKAGLSDVVSEVESLNKSVYTETSYKALEQALELARVIMDKDDATDKQIAAAQALLEHMRDRLVEAQIALTYTTHVQDIGWMTPAANGEVGGTSGQSKRVEGLKLNLLNNTGKSLGIEYSIHIQSIGWQEPVASVTTDGTSSEIAEGTLSGTSGQSLRLEALRMNLTGELADNYDIYYRVHAQEIGWMAWAKNGEDAGTAGLAYRLEAVQVYLAEKDTPVPNDLNGVSCADDAVHCIDASGISGDIPFSAQAHIQNKGDMTFDPADGTTIIGTSGEGLRMEAIQLALGGPIPGLIAYSAHVQNIGWQDPVTSHEPAGTSGMSLRVEALRIGLVGDISQTHDIYYRTHVQNIGWTGWAKNGEDCGSSGLGYRMEAVQIVIVEKGTVAPGLSNGCMARG